MRASIFKRYSTLFALIGLALMFELLGRLFESQVRDAYSAFSSGGGSFANLVNALREAFLIPDPAFLSARNLTNLTLQVATNGCLAVGMTLIILTGGIDLSIGSVVALTGIVLGLCAKDLDAGLTVTLLGPLAAGLVVGAINGVLIARFSIPPFVITLGMLVVARGFALIFSNSSAISPLPEGIRFLGSGFLPGGVGLGLFLIGFLPLGVMLKRVTDRKVANVPQSLERGNLVTAIILYAALGGLLTYVFYTDRGVPVSVLIMGSLGALGIVLAGHTVFGRSLYAIGGSESAALLSGINVKRVKFLAYTLMGLIAGVGGILLSGRLNSATPTEGQLMELDAIASCVIGGTSLRGGVGRIQGSLIGAFIIGTLNNGMDMLEISSNWQMVMKGLIIILAVYLDARLLNSDRT